MNHVIIIEERAARKEEKKFYGRTETQGNVTKIFINKKQDTQEFINTVFHELTHAFNHMHGFKGTDVEEERLARTVGNVVEPLFRKYKRGKTSEYKRTGKN